MAFFQHSVRNKYIQTQDKETIQAAYRRFHAYFHSAEIQQNIRDSKEEQFQEGFLRELFVNVLGYTLNPSSNYNLTTELKNEKGAKKADGAILHDGSALAVIELKGTDTKDLDKINAQAFNYKNNQRNCIYVITSNFEKLRFFIHNAVEHIEFNLFTLTEDDFQLLWLCLSADSLLKGIPLKVKEDSLVVEEKITKQLYKDYATFRSDLWHNMIKNRSDADQLLLFKKTQKLLDRFLFIFFAEDKDLLPPNSISEIVKQWEKLKELDEYRPLYDRFKKYFGYLNTGWQGKNYEIFAYNGGLFLPDEVLDSMMIDDEVLHPHVMKLTSYDFQSEVDVNILGHIFENSLNEIENITAQLEGQEVDKSKTKRKKDGVYYTPKYITKYIVDNTIGRICEEKKAALEIIDEEYAKGRRNRKKETIKSLDAKLQAYRDWLLNITICDPACGSGAFLNQTLEFLIAEHTFIDELNAQLFGSSIVFQDVENHILEKNIFGVDINEESVEIAKLSLWLRTAQKGRKLTLLNKNIKCGNSLIDDPEVAGEKAFNWQQEFPEVFAQGGFDVVIGNPPYVVLSSFENKEFEYLQKKFKTAYGRLNLFALFIEKCSLLVREKGHVGLIIPDSLCLIDYYSDLRKYMIDNYSINGLFEIGNGIFEDATVPALIVLFDRSKREKNIITIGNTTESLLGGKALKNIDQNYFYKTPKNSFNLHIDEVFIKLNEMVDKKKASSLKSVLQIKIGICTGSNKKHLNNEAIFKNSKKVLQGKDINRYKLSWGNLYVNYDKKDLLRSRDEAIFLKPEKLLMRQTSDRLILSYDNKNFYTIDSLFIIYPKKEGINIKYYLALLNSKLLNHQYQKLNPESGRVFAQVKIDYVNELPVKATSAKEQNSFVKKVDTIMVKVSELQHIQSQFTDLLQSDFELPKLSKNLENWYQLDFKGFLQELKKKKIELGLSEKAEWMKYFNEQKQQAETLKSEINQLEKEIDVMVYALYGLTEEEIAIVENS